jgi:hypothetical protein
VAKYLTDDEIARYTGIKKRFAKKDSLSTKQAMELIEKKVMEWLGQSLYEEYFNITVTYLTVIHVNSKDSLKLIAAKDSIYSELRKTEEISPAHYIDACCSYMHNDAYQNLLIPKSKSAEEFKKYEKVFDIFGDEFNYKLLMPGTIVTSNAEETHVDTLSWKLTAYKYFFHNYQLTAKSRTINFWTLWVTLGFLVLLIGGVILKNKSAKIHTT